MQDSSYDQARRLASGLVDDFIAMAADMPAPQPEDRKKLEGWIAKLINGIAGVVAKRIREEGKSEE